MKLALRLGVYVAARVLGEGYTDPPQNVARTIEHDLEARVRDVRRRGGRCRGPRLPRAVVLSRSAGEGSLSTGDQPLL